MVISMRRMSGVMVDGDQRFAGHGVTALLAFAGEGQRLLVGTLADRNALQADAQGVPRSS
jgi:hypothetical protein